MFEEYRLATFEIVGHLQELDRIIIEEQLEAFISELQRAKSVFVYGAGRSGFVARCFVQRLMQIGIISYFVSETITPSVTEGDLLVAITGSGETPTVLALLRTAKELKVRRFVVSTREKSSAAALSQHILKIPGKTKLLEKKSHAPFTSLFDIAALTVLDGIVAELMNQRGITDVDIQKTHANLE